MNKSREAKRLKRKKHVRKNIFGTSEKPRLCVYRSTKHISAQIIDDVTGKTLVAASSVGKTPVKGSSNKEGAKKVGEMIAEKAKTQKITKVVFDRSGFQYHGRIKELADAAREKGLKF